MATETIKQPFPFFTDASGEELENGYIYVGTAGADPESNPITVYWDADLSVPAAQPLRTINGIVSRGGRPARAWVGTDYSIKVTDSRGSVVRTSLSGNNSLSEGGITVDATSITTTASGGVERTQASKNSDVLSVKDIAAVDSTGTTDSTAGIQSAIDAAVSAGRDLLFPAGSYKVTKNTDLSGFPGNDEPCLLVTGASGIRIYGERGTRIFCETHAQGILEVQLSDNVLVEGIEFEGAGDFPGNDGTTGRGEKGTSSEGYNTSSIWGAYKNNSNDTSAESGGGFGGAFPQDGGGTAATWGTWNGGYIGNVAYGVLVHNGCSNVTVSGCKASGFNYVGFGVGHNGDYTPVDRGYADSTDVQFVGCESRDNYSAGIHSMAVDGLIVSGCRLVENGHPDSVATDDNSDPGYGYTGRGTVHSSTRNAELVGNICRDNRRRGLDVHTGENFSIVGNSVKGSRSSGIYFSYSNSTLATRGLSCVGNTVSGCCLGNGALGSIYIGGLATGAASLVDAVVANNSIRDFGMSGIRARYVDGAVISGNVVRNQVASETAAVAMILALGNSGTSQRAKNVKISGNHVLDSGSVANRGIQLSYCADSSVDGNTANMTGSSVTAGVDISNCETTDIRLNSSRLGSVGAPINANQSEGLNFGNAESGGDASSQLGSNSAYTGMRVAETIRLSVTMNGTATPASTVRQGGKYFASVSSLTEGMRVTLQNIGSASIVTAHWSIANAESLNDGGSTTIGFIYSRAESVSAIDLGFKVDPSTGHTAASALSQGVLEITIIVN